MLLFAFVCHIVTTMNSSLAAAAAAAVASALLLLPLDAVLSTLILAVVAKNAALPPLSFLLHFHARSRSLWRCVEIAFSIFSNSFLLQIY